MSGMGNADACADLHAIAPLSWSISALPSRAVVDFGVYHDACTTPFASKPSLSSPPVFLRSSFLFSQVVAVFPSLQKCKAPAFNNFQANLVCLLTKNKQHTKMRKSFAAVLLLGLLLVAGLHDVEGCARRRRRRFTPAPTPPPPTPPPVRKCARCRSCCSFVGGDGEGGILRKCQTWILAKSAFLTLLFLLACSEPAAAAEPPAAAAEPAATKPPTAAIRRMLRLCFSRESAGSHTLCRRTLWKASSSTSVLS